MSAQNFTKGSNANFIEPLNFTRASNANFIEPLNFTRDSNTTFILSTTLIKKSNTSFVDRTGDFSLTSRTSFVSSNPGPNPPYGTPGTASRIRYRNL